MDGEQKSQMREWSTETENAEFQTPAVPSERRNLMGTTLGNAPDAPIAPGTGKSTCENFGKPAKKYNDPLYL